jgi:cytochrome b involved in lipid metabolism
LSCDRDRASTGIVLFSYSYTFPLHPDTFIEMSKRFSTADVASHKTASDLWIIVDEDVYDLTNFQEEHPGGKKILQRVAGKDASKQFWKYHNDSILKKYQKRLQVGSLDSKATPSAPPAAAAPETKAEKNDVVKPEANSGVVAPQPTGATIEESEPFDAYGDLVPYADPSWYQTVHLP